MLRKWILVVLGLSFGLLSSCEKNPAREKLQQMDVRYSKKEFLKRVEQSDYDAVELFLAAGMNPDVADKEGATVLMYAAREGNLEIVKLLMEKGADVNVNADGRTALGWAAGGLVGDEGVGKHAEVIRFLVERGTDVNAGTPIRAAVLADDFEIVRLLVEHGADVDAREGLSERTALMYAAQRASPEIVQYLLEHGADPNARMAMRTQDGDQVLRTLKELFVDPQPIDRGSIALAIAEDADRPEIVELLKAAGAK